MRREIQSHIVLPNRREDLTIQYAGHPEPVAFTHVAYDRYRLTSFVSVAELDDSELQRVYTVRLRIMENGYVLRSDEAHLATFEKKDGVMHVVYSID